jgi:hypothetical protein
MAIAAVAFFAFTCAISAGVRWAAVAGVGFSPCGPLLST